MTIILEAKGLKKDYSGKVVVDNLDLSIKSGEIVGLLGPNGAGKTTTVKMLYGALIPTQGSVNVFGFDLFNQSRLASQYLGVLPQGHDLDEDLSVQRNLLYFGRYGGLSYEEAYKAAQNTIEYLNLSEWADMKPSQLSGGLTQRVMLGRALLTKPKLLFLDEPTTGLDPDIRQDFWRLVLELKSKGKGVLITTHYMEEAEHLCDKIILIKNGRIISAGQPNWIVENIVGDEVIEVTGVALEEGRKAFGGNIDWLSPFSDGFVATLPLLESEEIVQKLELLHPRTLMRRQANLEDVFLKLTGEGFDATK